MHHATSSKPRRPAWRSALPAVLAGALTLAAGDASAALSISRWVVAGGGGGPSTGGNYSISGTFGQPAAGPASAGAYDLNGGFWGLLGGGSVSVGDPDSELDSPGYELRIFPTAPNPARSMARIQFELPDERRVAVRVFDINGRVVHDFATDRLSPGRHTFTWDTRTPSGQTVGAGIYFVQINLGNLVRTQRLAVIR